MTITIITPAWNNADTISDCLRSVYSQTERCQHIVIDGGSTDGTLDIINRQKNEDTILVSEPDQGMYDAINKGLNLAKGEIIGILNSDDFYADDTALERVKEAFNSPCVDASYADLYYVDRNDASKVTRNWKSGQYEASRFYNGWMPPHPTFFLKREWYEKYGGYRLDMGSAADYELMLRMLLKREAKATYIPKVLVLMRNAGISNASLKSRLIANRYDRKAWKVNHIKPRIWTMVAKPLSKITQWV